MRFDTSQQMRLSQQMKLAPRMIQSMEILQMAMPALEERIEQELENNVTLETFEPDASPEEAREEIAESRLDDSTDRKPMSVDEKNASEDFARLDSMEESYSEAFDNQYEARPSRADDFADSAPSSRAAGDRDPKQDAMANAPGRAASLTEQLLEQWSLADLDERTRALGRLIIEHIEDDGLLRTPLAVIADRAPQNIPDGPHGAPSGRPTPDEFERALKAIHLFLEPVGIGARDVRECLLLQLDALADEGALEHEPAVRTLIDNHLDDLINNRLPRVAADSGLSIDEINAAVKEMARLSVAPGKQLSTESPAPIVPDAVVEYDDEHDRYTAYITDGRLPNLRISREYAEMVRQRETPKPTREFIKTNLANAQWLIEALQQRRRTLQRVLNIVVDAQREFFDQGPQALKPLPMTQVAEQMGVHVATVSRAVADKHLLTPRGVFPLRRFFTGGTQTDSGEDVSWEAIRAAMKDVVDAEDKRKPLSDDAIVDELKKRGIEIARRTVAKYRAQLDIPSARMRKQF